MNILAIDTTMGFLSLALMKDETPLAKSHERAGLDVSRSILARLDTLLDGAKLTPADLDLLAVCRGPGSFTGTRIGIAVAQTFAQILAIPLIGIDSLHLLAAQTEPVEGVTFFAGLNCVRKEVYFAPYCWQGERLEAGESIKLTDYQGFKEVVAGRQTIVGRFESRHTLQAADLEALTPMPVKHAVADAVLLAREALRLLRSQPQGPFEPVEPLYIKSEVLRKWKA
jgi:tRNA threonylcarbamoyladenosine biosynthesis protein TsaB